MESLKGKKVAMTWAYSPSYGKPLSVPQGVIGLFTRFGMDVTLAHPEGYDVMPEVEEVARKNCEKYMHWVGWSTSHCRFTRVGCCSRMPSQ